MDIPSTPETLIESGRAPKPSQDAQTRTRTAGTNRADRLVHGDDRCTLPAAYDAVATPVHAAIE
jgi:hypothetical protein